MKPGSVAAASMRVVPAIALSLALLLPGCFGGDEEEPPVDGTTPTTPTGTGGTPTPTPGGSPTPPTRNGTGGGNNSGNTTGPRPTEAFSDGFDFQANAPEPGETEGVATKTFTLAAGFKKLTIAGNFSINSPAPAVVGTATSMSIADPAGGSAGSCTGPGAGSQAAATACTFEATTAPAGDYVVTYTGTANVRLDFTVVAS